MLSTQHLSNFPTIAEMRKTCKALAALEAIICPEWEYRYYSYNASWDEDTGEEVASMRDGEGDEFLILFDRNGAIINGFAADSEMNGWQEDGTQRVWAGVLDSVPQVFRTFLETEPIPSMGTTFCVWRKHEDTAWQMGKVNLPDDDYGDGSVVLLNILDGNPATYQAFAEGYYERPVALSAIEYVYAHNKITRAFVQELNPELKNLEMLKADLDEIGFPYDLA